MDVHEGPHGRFKVIDHLAFGRIIAHWAEDKSRAPTTIADLKAALEPNIALVPPRYTTMQVVQAGPEEYVLRLPPKAMIANTIQELSGPTGAPYAVPPFYFLKLRCPDGSAPGVSNDLINDLDFFYSRVADYTISVCR
jgi:hypothetical protein